MSSPGYYLDKKASGRSVIRQMDSDLAIDIYKLNLELFNPRSDKLQMFGNAGGRLFGFQTDLILVPEEAEVISDALHWYAGQIFCLSMNITGIDPRS